MRQFVKSPEGDTGIRSTRAIPIGADELLKHLTVRRSDDSNVIYLQFTSSTQRTADITNAFADR